MKINRFEPSPSLVAELATVAQQYRNAEAVQDVARKELTRATYNQVLQRHRAMGWNGALGEALEIPDAELPVGYVERRAQIIQQLKEELGDLSGRYRAFVSQTDQDEAVAQYHEVYDELWRIGHWDGIPYPWDQLNVPAMPARFQKLVAEGKQKLQLALDHFKVVARQEFSYLLERGYSELSVDEEQFAVRWSDGRTVVNCEGINWGENIRLMIGPYTSTAESSSYLSDSRLHGGWNLLKLLEPSWSPSAVGQEAQMREGAQALLHIADHVLRGDHTTFAQLAADEISRSKEWVTTQEAEETRLRAEGWVDGEFAGVPVLVKPSSLD